MGKRIVVLHGWYGCESGCCGHRIEIDGEEAGSFDFGHADGRSEEDLKAYARQLVTEQFGAEHCADLDWDECDIRDDSC